MLVRVPPGFTLNTLMRPAVSVSSVSTWLNPSSAKYSHCIGISTEFDADKAFKVNNPRDGGQSKIGLESTLDLVHGMFDFAVFDNKTKEVFLVRDRFGE